MEKIIDGRHKHINYKNSPAVDFSVIVITMIIFGISSIIGITKKLNADKANGQNAEKEKVSTECLSFASQ